MHHQDLFSLIVPGQVAHRPGVFGAERRNALSEGDQPVRPAEHPSLLRIAPSSRPDARPLERRDILRVRNIFLFPPEMREFPSPTLSDRIDQLRVPMFDKVLKRGRFTVLLSHEEERYVRGQQHERDCDLQRVERDLCAQSIA